MQEEGEIKQRDDLEENEFEEILITPKPGGTMILVVAVLGGAGALCFLTAQGNPFMIALGYILAVIGLIVFRGIKTLDVNEAILATFNGEYVGTFKEPGYIWTNPLFSFQKVSLKT